MAMSDRSKKSNLCYLLLYGGTKVCRALFEKRVNDLKPNGEDSKTWTVDKFLQLNRKKLESKLGNEEYEKQTLLFPKAPRTTNINAWDVSLFCLVLRETCDLGPELRMFLQHLRKLRNKIVHHLNDEDIDDSKYNALFEKLEVCIDKVLFATGDETIKRTVQDMINQLKTGLIPNDELLKVEKTIEDIKQANSHEHKETRQVIEKGMQNVTSMLDKMMRYQQEMMRYQQEMLKRLGGQEQIENPPPEMTVEVKTCNCSHQASEVMAELFNKVIDNSSGLPACTEDIKELNHAVNDLCREFKEKDFTITKVDVGCIVLNIQCSSILSLLTLLRDYVNGSLDKSLTKLEEAARSLDGCENLRLETVIYEEEFNRVFSVLNFEQFLISAKEESSPDENLREEASAFQCASEKEKSLLEWAWSAIRGFLQPRKPSSAKFEGCQTLKKEESPPDVNLSEQTPVLQPASEKRKSLLEGAWSAIRWFLQPKIPSVKTKENKLLDEPWGIFKKSQKWTREYRDCLLRNMREIGRPNPFKIPRILLVGPTHSGISSFRNSVASIDNGRLRCMRKGSSDKVEHYSAKMILNGFILKDIRLEDEDNSSNLDSIIDMTEGNVMHNFKFKTYHARDKTYTSIKENSTLDDMADGVVYVISSHEVHCDLITSATIQKIKLLNDFLRKKCVPVVIVLTKIDLICTEVMEDLKRVYHSKAVMSVVRKASELFGVPKKDIFPVLNYTHEVELNTNQDILLLQAMERILEYSADRLEFLSDKYM